MNGLGDRAKKAAIEHVKQKAARDVLNGIKEWRANRISTAKRRWLFELIQNAVDTAKVRQNNVLKIKISENQDRIIFKHNSGHFNLDEISAVIYGGSRKPYAPESEYIGRFGTGFLVTHIVSRRVKVKGFVKENEGKTYEFEMEINRESEEEKSISQSIEKCFQQLNESKSFDSKKVELYTEFVYYLNDDLGREAVEVGINELKKNLPFVFAFNSSIEEININGAMFCRVSKKDNNGSIEITYVETDRSPLPCVYSIKDEEVGIGVAIGINDSEFMDLKELPKIYVGMPLIETADYIDIPFISNSIHFEPTKERDALSHNETNKKLVYRSLELYKQLLVEISNMENIKGLFRAITVSLVPEERASQNPLWQDFNRCIKKTFTSIIEEIPLVETFDKKKEVKSTIFPINRVKEELLDKELFERFYELISQIKKNIPAEELDRWINVVWRIKGLEDFSDYISLYSVEDMKNEFVKFVKEKENFPDFRDFNEEYSLEDSKQYLLSFIKIVDELYKRKKIPPSFIDHLLPAQTGIISPLNWGEGQLHIDNNIPEDFKNIVHKIGWKIRQELVDNDFANYDIVKDYVRSELNIDNALDRLIKDDELKPNAETIRKENWDDDNLSGWIEILRWCVNHGNLKKGTPVIVKSKKVRNIEVLNEESFIIPFRHININEEYEDIYPESRIMHSKYFIIENLTEFIEQLRDYKVFVTVLPLYKYSLAVGYNKLKSILKEEKQISKVEHSIETENALISFLPFLEQEIEGRVSQFQEQGKLLFKFIVEYLINQDDSWEKSVQVKCSCKDKVHEIIPSQWLASLKSDTWVPYKTIEDEEEKIVKREATKESIEHLFTSDEFDKLIGVNPNIVKLLPHFGFDELDLKIKLHSIKTDKPEKDVREGVSKFVNIIDIVPDLPDVVSRNPDAFRDAIEKLKDNLEKEPIRVENKIIGENLEKIIKKIISDRGFTVKPIYKGGDLEIWPEENQGWDGGLIEVTPYLIEIKFTSGSRVHLSKTQSEMARDKEEKYTMLVVENAGNLRECLKEIDENSISDDMISTVAENSYVLEKINTKLGDVPNPEEVEPDIHGYWIKKKLWTDKNNIINWIEQNFGDGV